LKAITKGVEGEAEMAREILAGIAGGLVGAGLARLTAPPTATSPETRV